MQLDLRRRTTPRLIPMTIEDGQVSACPVNQTTWAAHRGMRASDCAVAWEVESGGWADNRVICVLLS